MASARLTDSQKQELVERFQRGESTQALADQFGCSTTTVTRLVRTELGPEAYASLREERQKKTGKESQLPLIEPGTTGASRSPLTEEEDSLDSPTAGNTVLAIDDADDFGDDEDPDSDDDLILAEEDEAEDGDLAAFLPVPVLPIAVNDQQEIHPAPWSPALLPSCAYLLVDKTVELQARPLGEIPELGRLPSGEEERQALVLFTNPRQAKRQCGRSQRVIKLPDPSLLGRTAPYLLAQGITRVVIEGALYALPENP